MTSHWKQREKLLIEALRKIAKLDTASSNIAKKALLKNDGWEHYAPSDVPQDENTEICTIDGDAVTKLENFRGRLWHCTLEDGQVIQLDNVSSVLYAKPK